jgi:hypothetical protein
VRQTGGQHKRERSSIIACDSSDLTQHENCTDSYSNIEHLGTLIKAWAWGSRKFGFGGGLVVHLGRVVSFLF